MKATCIAKACLLLMLVLAAAELGPTRALGQPVRVGPGPDALPAVNEVPLSVKTQRGIAVRLGVGYGFTEAVLESDDTHHRTQLDGAVSLTPLPWLSAALRLLGRWDVQSGGSDDGDYGFITETHLTGRVEGAVSSAFRIGSELALWLPGGDTVGDGFAALSGDAHLLGTFVPPNSPLTLGLATGLRVDRSKYSGGDPDMYSEADRLALGASDSILALRLGAAMSYRLGDVDLLAEWSWKMYFDYAGESPMWFRAGARYRPSRVWQLELLVGASPSARLPEREDAPLAVVEPRVAGTFSAALAFPWEVEDTEEQERRARLEAERKAAEAARVRLRGRVLTPAAAPLPAAQIVLEQGDRVLRAESDAQGGFALEGMPPGQYQLSVSAEGWVAHEQPLQLSSGQNPELQITLKRELPRGQIRGTVRRFNGTPVRASIVIRSLEIDQQTGEDGAFEIDVPPGEYEVVVKARGFAQQKRRARVEQNGVAILIVELEPNKK
jgi:hypothetical protein